MIVLRIIVQTLMAILVLQLLALAAAKLELTLVLGFLSWLSPGHFLAFSLTLAALLNGRPFLLVVLLGVGLLVAFPVVRQDPVKFLFAICLGVAAALLVNALFNEAMRGQEE
jgi:hypothetical protein